MEAEITRIRKAKLVGGELCLDYANSLYWRASDKPFEWFSSYSELLRWCKEVGVVSTHRSQQLKKLAIEKPRAAARVLREAIYLREVIYRIFHKFSIGKRPAQQDVTELNNFLTKYLAHQRVIKSASGYELGWGEEKNQLDSILWPIAKSAADLLTGDEATRVGQCPGDDCGWLFVDRSRRANRRWCDMNDCGHRHNAKVSYRRARGR